MPRIPDINADELRIAETTLQERYGDKKDIQIVDTEVRVDASDRELTECPTLYWEDNECTFIVVKVGEKHYHPQFFYRNFEQFSTGTDRYDDLAQCVVSVLQTQADHDRNLKDSAVA